MMSLPLSLSLFVLFCAFLWFSQSLLMQAIAAAAASAGAASASGAFGAADGAQESSVMAAFLNSLPRREIEGSFETAYTSYQQAGTYFFILHLDLQL